MSNNNSPLLSIIVTTYGHEAYIEQALDSALKQKVTFEYEIIVGEDCSPDNTRTILKSYENEFPHVFRMIYRDKNIGAWKNSQDLLEKAKGKYIATLEGDDFWISEYKLQRQIEYLENNPEVIATAHNTKVVNENNDDLIGMNYPECKDEFYTLKHYRLGILPGQTATMVRRNVKIDNKYNDSVLDKIAYNMPGDRVHSFLLASHGKIYCFQEQWSAYRYVTSNSTSFSSRQHENKLVKRANYVNYYFTIMVHARKYIKNNNAVATIESIYFWQLILESIEKRKIANYNSIKAEFNEVKAKKVVIRYIMDNLKTLPNKMKLKVKKNEKRVRFK